MFVLSTVLVVLKLWFLSFVHFKVLFFEEDEILPLRSPFILKSLSAPGLAKVYWKVPAGPELLFHVHACSLGVN